MGVSNKGDGESKQQKDLDLDQATDYLKHRYNNINVLKNSFFEDPQIDDQIKEKLIVTDLFVEKDIHILTKRAQEHADKGYKYFMFAVGGLIVGALIAIAQLTYQIFGPPAEVMHWSQLVQSFAKPFTAYGFIVITSVALWKQSKAELDQAERILERRRANRILRTLAYLHKGDIGVEDLKNILQWSAAETNAFTNIKAEAQAPLGALVSDLLNHYNKLVTDILKDKSGTNGSKSA